ncbi:MAG TPA: MFS transporter [Pseudonocardiaceae bacterium]|jgi:MFS family permease|nr:MFS transporter [Pseudonocardiaceae bacterium]
MAGYPAQAESATGVAHITRLGAAPFRLLILAGFASLTGDGIRVAALPLFTAVSTHSPLAVSAVATAEVLPWLLIALPAGTLVDRLSPRRVVLAAHSFRAVVVGVLAIAVLTHHAGVSVLIGIAFLVTAGETFADSAYQSLLVELAGRDRLDRANSWYVSAETLGLDLGGPLLAAALFVWSPAACFGLNTLMFGVSAVCVAMLPDVAVRPAIPRQRDGTPTRLRRQLVEGTRYLLRDRALRTLVLAVVAAALAVSAANAIISLYAIETLAVRAALVPTLWAVQAIGTLCAAPVVPRLAARFGEGRVMVGALCLLGCAFVVVGAIPVAGAVWAAYLLVGMGAGGWNVLSATRRQRLTPGSLMGRVTSAYRMLAWGLMPLGAAAAGPLAKATSLATVFVVVGGVVTIVAVAVAKPLVRTGGT